MKTIFTGQEIVGTHIDTNGREHDEIICPQCGDKTHMGAAWSDKHHSSGRET